MVGFLLEGKTWPGAEAPDAPPELAAQAIEIAVVEYIAETQDYGIRIIALKNEQFFTGKQDVYIVEHRRHKVIANQFAVLPAALSYVQSVQEHLNECLGKDKAKQ